MKKAPKTKAAAPVAMDPHFAPVVAAFAGDDDVAVVQNFGNVGLRVKGKAFAMVVRGQLVVKLPKARVDALVGGGRGELFALGGRQMKEWVALAHGKEPWVELARESHRFVSAAKG
jgi:hypothetical protein